MVEIALPVKS